MTATIPAAEPFVLTVPATVTPAQIEQAITQLSRRPGTTPGDYAADASARAIWDTALTTRAYTGDQARRMSQALFARLIADKPITGPCSVCGEWERLDLLDDDAVCTAHRTAA